MFTPNFHIDSSPHQLAVDFRNAVNQIGVLRSVEKSEVIIDSQTSAEFFFYVQDGIFKTTKKIGDREFVLGFTFPGDVDGDPGALLENTVSDFSMEAVTKSEVLLCRWKDLASLLQAEKYHLTVNYFLTKYVSVLQHRLIDAIAMTAEDRYKEMIAKQAQHLSQIPVSDLASFLGITKQSMSRIRSSKF